MAAAARFRQHDRAGIRRRRGYARPVRSFLRFLAGFAALIVVLAVWGHRNARVDPIVRRATVTLPDWPAGQAPLNVLLMSDVHFGNSTMDAPRLSRIVVQANALKPDLMLIAGDFVAGHDPDDAVKFADAFVAPLSGLHARLGVVATLGNHDQATRPGAIHAALMRARITVLMNDAASRGPLAIAGLDDGPTGNQDISLTLAALARLKGARIALTHSPVTAGPLPDDIGLLLVGHTHCGQIVLPLYGPIKPQAPPPYNCGLVRVGGRTTIITAGLGTSVVPFRFGAPPDMWLITLGPAARAP
jgi:predicted MPP superfamily phosphohydrolase